MSEERLQEIKDSVSFQKEILLAHNMDTLCTDEEEELIEEIERLNNIINELEKTLKELIKEQEDGYKKYPENWEERKSVCNTWLRSRDCYLCIYNYLQELKESDKE